MTAVYAWSPAHAVVWPRSGGAGTCSHQAPDSCSYCDGSDEDARDRRAAKRAETGR
jgi:hypothetical protein